MMRYRRDWIYLLSQLPVWHFCVTLQSYMVSPLLLQQEWFLTAVVPNIFLKCSVELLLFPCGCQTKITKHAYSFYQIIEKYCTTKADRSRCSSLPLMPGINIRTADWLQKWMSNGLKICWQILYESTVRFWSIIKSPFSLAEVSQVLEMQSAQRSESEAQCRRRYRFTPLLPALFKALKSAHNSHVRITRCAEHTIQFVLSSKIWNGSYGIPSNFPLVAQACHPPEAFLGMSLFLKDTIMSEMVWGETALSTHVCGASRVF